MRSTKEGKSSLLRLILAMVAGIVAWMLVASLLNIGLRLTMPGYTAAEPDKSFTLAMQLARLLMGALASLAGGAAAGWIDRPAGASVWIIAAALLAAFIPAHVSLWLLFPVWYHLTFLLSLAPLTVLGSLLVPMRASAQSSARQQQASPSGQDVQPPPASPHDLDPSTDKANGSIGSERPGDITAK